MKKKLNNKVKWTTTMELYLFTQVFGYKQAKEIMQQLKQIRTNKPDKNGGEYNFVFNGNNKILVERRRQR